MTGDVMTAATTVSSRSARSFLVAGISTAMVGTALVTPVLPRTTLPDLVRVASPAVQLTSVGDVIINTYDLLEPWVAYGFELADWALSFVPGLWWVAPGIDLAYFTVEPVVQSLVFSFAYFIDGNFDLIGPTLADGLTTAAANFVTFAIDWLYSLVPFPPLPPFIPPFPRIAAATASDAGLVSGSGRVGAAAVTADIPADEIPADTATPADETPADETPADTATPAEGTPADEAPADTATPAEEVEPDAVELIATTGIGPAAVSGKRGATRASARSVGLSPGPSPSDAVSADAGATEATTPVESARHSADRRTGSGDSAQQQRRR